MLYLSEAHVKHILPEVDVVDTIRRALIKHAGNETLLPHEAYLGWSTKDGLPARSLCLPAGLRMDHERDMSLGVKIINSSLANVGRGHSRASGLCLLFDQDTAGVLAIMAAASISASRTAAVSQLAIEACAVSTRTVGVVGNGRQARAHLELLLERTNTGRVVLFDRDWSRADALAAELEPLARDMPCDIDVVGSVEHAIKDADVVITTTTSNQGYIPYEWLKQGAVFVHVSLDDALPDVVDLSEWIIVDSWDLVSSDSRRLLGRMASEGLLEGPSSEPQRAPGPVRRVDAELGQVLTGEKPARVTENGVVFVNPFGLGICDVALMAVVHSLALRTGVGVRLSD